LEELAGKLSFWNTKTTLLGGSNSRNSALIQTIAMLNFRWIRRLPSTRPKICLNWIICLTLMI